MSIENHRPGGSYQVISIRLFECMHRVRLSLECTRRTVDTNEIVEYLTAARDSFFKMSITIVEFRHRMIDENLSMLSSIDFDNLRAQCVDTGVHPGGIYWQLAVDTIRSGGFQAILNLFDEKVQRLLIETDVLMSKYKNTKSSEVESAQLDKNWEQFYQLFQASHIISTILSYHQPKERSASGRNVPTRAVA